jgi:hypothetical protein
MVEIYVDQISERLIYTLDFVFKERGLTYKLNNDYYTFETSNNLKFNYSERYFESIPQLVPSTLLFDEAIFIYAIEKGLFHEEVCLSFNRIVDPLASIFYILSRMEEYTSTHLDEHGRFQSKYSILSEFGWLQKAVCDQWAVDFLNLLSIKVGIDNSFLTNYVTIRPTFDIDNAYAYRLKFGIRKYLSILKDFIKKDKDRLAERKLVLKGVKADPYDTYSYIDEIIERGFKVNVFWLLADYAKFDKNITYKNDDQANLIRKVAEKAVVGIHPGYRSNSYPLYVENEMQRLSYILGDKIVHSRQHFLRLSISKTYSTLLKLGVENDYTMGYADNVGFRAGTARPFLWFDLNRNKITDLTIHPFVYMDGTLNEYLKISTEESCRLIDELYKEVSKYGGDFVFIWHNETIGDYKKWEGWKSVLEHSLNLKNT